MARPAALRVNTLVALPEVSPDFRTFTFRLRPGILFQDDPAFKGQPRELVAADYVYSWKRIYDPRWKSPMLFVLENSKVLGLSELRAASIKGKRPFDYDARRRGPAGPRPLHAAAAARRTESAHHLQLRRRVAVRRRGARGRRGLRRRHHGAPGRHRAVPPGRLDPFVAHRARTQSDLSGGTLRLRGGGRCAATCCRRRHGCRAAACRWSTESRSRSSRSRSRAGWRSCRASSTSSTPCPSIWRGSRHRTASSPLSWNARVSRRC